jgi:hypothetical protein
MAAFTSFGTTLKVGATAGTPPAYTLPSASVGEILSLNLDGLKLNTIDVSNLGNQFRTYAAGLIDSGTVSLEVNLDPDDAQQVTVLGQLDVTAATTRPVLKSWLITFGNGLTSGGATNPGCTFSFIGFVTDFSVKGAIDSAVTASISIKISGSVTFTDQD